MKTIFFIFLTLNVLSQNSDTIITDLKPAIIKDIVYSREDVFDEFYNKLISGIENKNIPSFFYDNCLDNKQIRYTYVDSENLASLRYDLIFKLTKSELINLFLLVDKNKFEMKCESIYKEIPYSNLSTLELLENRIRIKFEVEE